jgi:hypothetical protein
LPDSRATWEAIKDFLDRKGWPWFLDECGSGWGGGFVDVGRAILRARKRWEKDAEATLAAAAIAGSIGADVFGVVRRERDQLRTKLREALDHLYHPDAVAEMSREEWLGWWRPACGLAGIGEEES